MSKSAEWHENRRKGIGGSDANILMSGNGQRIFDLWQEKRGKKEPDDLSLVLPVIMGSALEDTIRYYFSASTGREVTQPNSEHCHDEHSFMRCEADGILTDPFGLFEAKFAIGGKTADDKGEQYQPQLHHNMLCCGAERATLAVLNGFAGFSTLEVEMDPFYAEILVEREAAFWEAVQSGKPPVDMPSVTAPVPQSEWRTVDMTGSNEWAAAAADWLECKEPAIRFKKADKALKELLETDIGLAFGHGIQIKRAKNNSLRISEDKKNAA